MTPSAKKLKPPRSLSVEHVGPAMALLALGQSAKAVAHTVGASTSTILRWLDWAGQHQQQVTTYLRNSGAGITDQHIAALFARVEQRHERRRRRTNFDDWCSRPR